MSKRIPQLDPQAISNFRGNYPQYADLPDSVLFSRLYEKSYSDLSIDDFQSRFNNKFGLATTRNPEDAGSIGDAGLRGLKILGHSAGNLVNFGSELAQKTPPVVAGDFFGKILGFNDRISQTIDEKTDKVVQGIHGLVDQIPADPATGIYARGPESAGDYVDPSRIAMIVLEQGPQMVALMAATIANPVLGGALMFGVEGGETLSVLEEHEKKSGEKIGDHTKLMLSMSVGAINGALEKLGLDLILGKVPGLKSRVVQMLLSPAGEGLTEGLQGINQKIAETLGTGSPLLTAENLNELKQEIYAGMVLGSSGIPIQATQQFIENRKTREDQPGESPQIEAGEQVSTISPDPPILTENDDSAISTDEIPFDVEEQQQPDQEKSDLEKRREELLQRVREFEERDKRQREKDAQQQNAAPAEQSETPAEPTKPVKAAKPAKTVREWAKRAGRIKTDHLKEHGFGDGSSENRNLILQLGSQNGLGVDELAEQAISEGIIPQPPADTNPADWFMQQVRDNAPTQEADIAAKESEFLPTNDTGPKLIRGQADVKRSFVEEFSLPEDQADAVSKVYDAVAGAWANVTGKKKADWYRDRIAGVEFKGNPDSEDVLFQTQENAPIFYLKLSHVIDGKMGGAATPEQLLAMIRKNGVKKEELEWSGLQQFLAGKKKVSKADVSRWIEENSVQVEEVVRSSGEELSWIKTNDRIQTPDGEFWITENENGYVLNQKSFGAVSTASSIDVLKNEAKPLQVTDTTEFSEYTLPGGQNYRELLLTLPAKSLDQISQEKFNKPYEETNRAEQATVLNERNSGFISNHFNEKNILAHARFNERTTPDGKKVLFIEEIQSDWHQAGRKKGYDNAYRSDVREDTHVWVVYDANGTFVDVSKTKAKTAEEAREYAEKYKFVLTRHSQTRTGVPNAPFKTTWPELTFKRMMRWAAENGFDQIAWTTGAQQADRFDLSKDISRVTYTSGAKVLRAYDKNGNRVFSQKLESDAQLEDFIGKEVAQRLLNSPTKNIEPYSSQDSGFSGKELEGLDLKTGGEGMKTFYDKMLVSTANKLGKKFEAKVSNSLIQTLPDTSFNKEIPKESVTPEVLRKAADIARDEGDPEFEEAIRKAAETLESGEEIFSSYYTHGFTVSDYVSKALGLYEKIIDVSVHSLPVTDKMRFSLLNEGMPLFQRKKGAVQFLSDGRAIIHAFQQADVSTAIHELAHIFRRDLSAADQQIVLDWAGSDIFTEAVEEKFARAFERYLREGHYDNNSKLKEVLDKFQAWLSEIYKKVKGSAIDVELSAEIIDLFDRALGIQSGKPKKSRTRKVVGSGKQSSGSGARASSVGRDLPLDPQVKSDFNGADLDNVVTLRGIAEGLAAEIQYILGQDLRSGLIKRFSRRAKGLFFPDSGIIRVNNINDLSTLAHEIGHYLDLKIFKFGEQAKFQKRDRAVVMALGLKDAQKRGARLSRLKQELGEEVYNAIVARYELRKELYAVLEAVNYPKAARNVEEGIAEFVSHYITDVKFCRTHAPKFLNMFETMLEQNEGLHTALKNAQKNFRDFSRQDPRQLVESTIYRKGQTNRILESLKAAKDTWYSNLVDGTYALRDLEKKLLEKEPQLSSDRNPLLQFLSTLGAHGKLEQCLNNHPFRRTAGDVQILKDKKPLIGSKKNPGILYPILQAGKIHEFEGYLVALRNIEMFKRAEEASERIAEIGEKIRNEDLTPAEIKELKAEIPHLRTEAGLVNAATIDLKTSRQAVNEANKANPGFKKAQKELVEFQDWALQYYRDSGKLSDEQYQQIRKLNKFYVPFKRYVAEWETQRKQPSLGTFLKDTSPTPVKRIRGSEREVMPPVGSIIRNTFDMISAADQNRTLQTVVSALSKIDKSLVQEIPAKIVKPVMVLPKDADGDVEIRYSVPQSEKPNTGHIVSVWRNGELKYYDIPKEHYDALFTVYEPVSKAIRALSIPSNILRAGAVQYDPTFAVRNVPRDQFSALFYSKYNYNPWHFFKGMAQALKKDEVFEKFLASGADQSFLTIVFEQMQGKGTPDFSDALKSRWGRYRSKPWKILSDFNALSEMGTRIGAFQNAFKKSGDVFRAMEEARTIGADYSIKGNAMRNIIPLLPFFNARIQHARIFLKSAKDRPGQFVAKGMMYITVPAMINWFFNHGDDEVAELYHELPNWRKVGLWNIHIPGTKSFLPVPKGPAGILFGTTAEYFLDWVFKNEPDYLGDIATEFFKEISPISDVPGIVPQFARPLLEQAYNKVGYTGQPIVPTQLEPLAPELQFKDNTAEIIKVFGKISGLSPVRVQHFLTSYTAGTGKGALYVTDEILGAAGLLEVKPDDTFTRLSKIPLVRGFVTETPIGTRSKSVQDFYRILDRMDSLNRSVNNLATSGDEERLAEFLADDDRQKLYRYYLENKKSINLLKQILRINRDLRSELNRERTPGRHERIQDLNAKTTEIARRFHQAFKAGRSFETDQMMEDIKKLGKDLNTKKKERKNSNLPK